MKIEGVPEGWELVRIGFVEAGEHYISFSGGLSHNSGLGTLIDVHPIIRKVEPACSWPHGVFADGWIAEDSDGSQAWYDSKPVHTTTKRDVWTNNKTTAYIFLFGPQVVAEFLAVKPVFRADLPWTERIQQVGPTIEKGGV